MTASINRVFHYIKKEIIYRQPKTQKGKRLIPLTPATCVVLREHLEARKNFLKSLDPDFDPEKDFENNELIFCHFDGSPYLPNSVTHAWIKLTRRNGLAGIRLHDCRHTFASILLKQGVHAKVVQEMLGHSSIQITLDTYSHILPGIKEAASAKMDDILKPKESKLEKELQEIVQK